MRTVRNLVVIVACMTLLSSCFTGKRAHFAEAAPPVADPAIAAVIAKLEGPANAPYTATYTILTKFGNQTTQATVAQTTPLDRSTTIGNVRFLQQASGSQTCQLTTAACVPDVDDAQVSNFSLTHEFAKTSPAARLRQDAQVSTGAAVASTKDVAGQTATCAEVPFAEGTKTYCALDNGLLAYQDTPDLQITLTGYSTAADPALFATTTVPAG